MYDKARAFAPENLRKVNELRRSVPRIYFFCNVFEKKVILWWAPRSPFKPGSPDICQVCQVGDQALPLALVTITEVGIL